MKRTLLAVLLLSSFSTGPVRAESPVDIPDRGLKAAIENELWVVDPTPTDMLGLTHFVAIFRGISDLKGLEYAINLQVLGFRDNQISDLKPLSGLTQLVSLNLSMNQISDLAPLAGLRNLKTLDVHDNPMITDLSAVAGMTSLGTLIVRFNSVSDVSPLAGSGNLQHVELAGNRISTVAPLCKLTSLDYLDLRYNPLSLDACTVHIPRIEADNPGVSVARDQCDGFSIPWTVSLSSTAGGSVNAPGEGDFVFRNDEIIWLTAAPDPCFVFAGWSGDASGSTNPTTVKVSGGRQVRAHFVSMRSELYVDANAPDDPHEDGSPAHPFDCIQEAIEVAGDGAFVIVRPGTYRENVSLLGRKARLIAVDPENPHGGPCAVIEGIGDGPAVSIPSGSGSDCGLSGFVITRAKGRNAVIHCTGSSPTLANCLIVGNRCSDSNGGTLLFQNSRAILTHCTMVDNYSGPDGAGMVLIDSDVTVLNSILWGNRPNEILFNATSSPLILHGCVRGGWAAYGNIDGNPMPARSGSWVDPNNPMELIGPENPRAIWLDGDYHLKSQAGRWDPGAGLWVRDEATSPCIDAGDKTSPIGHEPAPNGGIVNLGAYGGTSEASMSHPATALP